MFTNMGGRWFVTILGFHPCQQEQDPVTLSIHEVCLNPTTLGEFSPQMVVDARNTPPTSLFQAGEILEFTQTPF